MKCGVQNIIWTLVFFFLSAEMLPAAAQKIEKDEYFSVINTRQGLSDNCILQMMQLPDGRLAMRTQKGIDIYDGKHFAFVLLCADKMLKLPKYNGQTHLYADNQNRLWVKDCRQVYCVDLVSGKLEVPPLDSVEDLFVDSRRNVWMVKGDTVTNTVDGSRLLLHRDWGCLQDMDTDGKYVYTFYESGKVAVFKGGKLVDVASAYSPSEALRYRNTSLTVQTPSGQFYQIRTGYDAKNKNTVSVFLHFNPITRKYSTIFSCPYLLHTLNMSSDNQALISSQSGYLMFDFRVGNTPREVRNLSLPDGKSLTTGINTVCRDREGAIWLGTYHDGLIYVSPMLGLFFTIDTPWWQSVWGVVVVFLLVVALMGICWFCLRRKRNNVAKAETVDDCILPKVESEFMQKVHVLVVQHLEDSEYGVEQLANDLCMERTGLYKKLTASAGTTPVSFIRNIRLQRAAELLKEGELSVNDIAWRTGFSSPSYFTKCFKKAYGKLPSEYK